MDFDLFISYVKTQLIMIERLLGVDILSDVSASCVDTTCGDLSNLGSFEYSFTFRLSPRRASVLASSLPCILSLLSSLCVGCTPLCFRHSASSLRNYFTIGIFHA